MTRIFKLGVIAALLATPLSVNAAGSGGGGGGDVPSASAPAYDPNVEYQKGVAALKAGDFKSAEKAFGRVLSVVPRDANTQYLLGLARSGQDNHKGAVKAFQKAVKTDPALVLARQQLAVSAIRIGDLAMARAERDALEAQSRSCANTCASASELKAALGVVDAALTAANAGPATAPAPQPGAFLDRELGPVFGSLTQGDAAYLTAVSFINEGRYDQALLSLDQASAALGPHPDILTYRGYIARKTGDFGLAEQFYRQALVIAPEHRGAHEYYGELKVLSGNIDGARHLLARLDRICSFGCAEADELRRWIDTGPP